MVLVISGSLAAESQWLSGSDLNFSAPEPRYYRCTFYQLFQGISSSFHIPKLP
jgi:hypothetical protein